MPGTSMTRLESDCVALLKVRDASLVSRRMRTIATNLNWVIWRSHARHFDIWTVLLAAVPRASSTVRCRSVTMVGKSVRKFLSADVSLSTMRTSKT